ncbi:MAG TPA: hypothetical protein VIT83_05375, partial [Gammaproteobacteria bacterium]
NHFEGLLSQAARVGAKAAVAENARPPVEKRAPAKSPAKESPAAASASKPPPAGTRIKKKPIPKK